MTPQELRSEVARVEDQIEHCRYCHTAKTKKRNKIRHALAAGWQGWTEDYATGYYSFMPEQCVKHRQALAWCERMANKVSSDG